MKCAVSLPGLLTPEETEPLNARLLALYGQPIPDGKENICGPAGNGIELRSFSLMPLTALTKLFCFLLLQSSADESTVPSRLPGQTV